MLHAKADIKYNNVYWNIMCIVIDSTIVSYGPMEPIMAIIAANAC